MNVNNGAHAQQYTQCLPALAEDPAVPVTPVCRYLYIDDVVHYFEEAPGANLHNVTVTINLEPMELIIDAAVQREHRLDRLYLARIQMDGYDFILETRAIVFLMGRFMSGFLLCSMGLKFLHRVVPFKGTYHHTFN